MGTGEAQTNTLQAQSSALLKECYLLLAYLRSNMMGEQPKEPGGESPSIANPIDDSINKIEEARKVIEETRAFLADSVINKLR